MAPPVMPAAPSVQPVPVVPFDGAGSDPSFAAPGWDLAGHLGGLTLTDTTAAVIPADPVSLNSSQESQIQASTEEPVESSEVHEFPSPCSSIAHLLCRALDPSLPR